MDDYAQTPGHRKDGKPYQPGNTRDDGSYDVGRNRPPSQGQFAVGDGRKRGRRSKGTKNLATDWAEELAERITITEGGKARRVTKQRALVKSTVARAMKSSDRAAETAFRHAASERRSTTALALSDSEIIELWQAQRVASLADGPPSDSAEVRPTPEYGDDQ